MKEIISVIKPFTYTQNIFVYENGKKIDVISTNTDDLPNKIIDLADEYETSDIKLVGSSKFSKGIQGKIEIAEMTRYNKNMLNIELINN